MLKQIIGLGALIACSACQSLGWSTPISSQFVTPNNSGEIQELDDFFGSQPPVITSATTGNQIAYHVNFNPDLGIRGYAGVVPGAEVVPFPPTTSQMTMNGFYRVEWEIYETATTNNLQLEQQGLSGGNITLVADVNNGTLIGSSDGSTDLEVSGTFTGTDLSGSVTYLGVDGDLRGLVGGNEAVGAFHGHDTHTVFAGGLIAN